MKNVRTNTTAEPFLIVPNSLITDVRLEPQARFALIYVMHLRPGEEFSCAQLRAALGIAGNDRWQRIRRQLADIGAITLTRHRDDAGKVWGTQAVWSWPTPQPAPIGETPPESRHSPKRSVGKTPQPTLPKQESRTSANRSLGVPEKGVSLQYEVNDSKRRTRDGAAQPNAAASGSPADHYETKRLDAVRKYLTGARPDIPQEWYTPARITAAKAAIETEKVAQKREPSFAKASPPKPRATPAGLPTGPRRKARTAPQPAEQAGIDRGRARPL